MDCALIVLIPGVAAVLCHDFPMWFSKIHASRVLDVPVLPLSGRMSPQLCFPSVFIQERGGGGAWNRQRSWRGSAASQKLGAAPRGDKQVSHSVSSRQRHLGLHENLSPALPGLLCAQRRGRGWGFGWWQIPAVSAGCAQDQDVLGEFLSRSEHGLELTRLRGPT